MNDPGVIVSEMIIASLAMSVSWCASQLTGLRALRSQRKALKRAKLRVMEKENELAEAVERALRGDPKIDTTKVRFLLMCRVCPNCGESAYISRSRRCYGKTGECPDYMAHFHSKCTNCEVDWLECTPEQTVYEREQEKKKK